jgi:DNA-binding NarL/FixJ family response regulator
MSTTHPIRILIAEDHQLVREGIRSLLSASDDLRVIAEAADGQQALQLAQDLGPDVVIMDVGLPILNGVEATRQLRAARPDIRVLILTMHDDAATVDRALRAGAQGYMIKGCATEELCEAIRAVHRGAAALHPSISQYVLQGYLREGEGGEAVHDPLTSREREILQLIAEGFTSHEIADRLHVKVKTIQNYRSIILDKLGLDTTAALVRYAMRIGLTR